MQNLISNLPDGKLVCCHHKNKEKWYISNGHTKTYIPKTNEKLAQQLAIKKYYSCLLEELIVEKKALEAYLNKPHIITPKSKQLLTDVPAYQKLLSSHFKTNDEYISEWINSPYKKNTKHTENLIHKTASGHLVRSKSEALIDLSLFTNQIPFRYECALELENITLYPDFTIMHPETSEIFYWEHFGKMDNISYRQNTGSKLQTYCNNNIIPNVNLITTFETQDSPLNSQQVQEIINYYFK